MAEYKPHVCLDVYINSQEYTLSEGCVVKGLAYNSNGTTKCLSGAIRVINTESTKYTSTKTCPPESYFDKTVTCPSIVVDSSEKYKAVLTTISLSDIVAISSVENDRHDSSTDGVIIVDDVTDIDPDDVYENMTVLDRIEE